MYKFFMALFLLYVPASMSALHGCVILKFVGDGLLAIFPVANPVEAARAAGNALAAAQEAQAALGVLRARATPTGEPPLEIVIALHYGTVI
jgi:adenylate cyclase